MPNGNRQFDPVASAATAAVNATQRSVQTFQSNMGAPQLPAQSQAFTQTRSIFTTLSQVSPVNVLVSGQPPQLPGMQGQSPLPNLPGLQGQGQSPLANLPPTPQGLPGPDMSGGGGGGGGGGNTSTAPTSNGGSRDTSESRT